MSSTSQPKLSSRNPTLKRILKEASELASQPSPDYHAAPLETDLFEWHFTLRGPPAPSPFENGAYHGRIVLPPAYPLKPPSFRFLTPTGRFEANREICLSISGHHEETWQPAWGIRTALVALRSFMDTDAKGQLGGMDASDEVRRRWAGQSSGWKCPVCSKCNGDILKEQVALSADADGEKVEESVPEELRLAFREDMGKEQSDKKAEEKPPADEQAKAGASNEASSLPAGKAKDVSTTPSQSSGAPLNQLPSTAAAPAQPAAAAHPAPPQQQQRQAQAQPPRAEGVPSWIDKAIIGVLLAIALLLWQRYLA